MKNKLKRFITSIMVLTFVLGSMAASPFVARADTSDEITVNFPGVDGVTVRFSTPVTGWQPVTTDATDTYTFNLPPEAVASHGNLTVQVIAGSHNGMSYRFDFPVADLDAGGTVLDVPVLPITVTGISSAANLGVVQDNWVYPMAPAIVGAPNVFNVFANVRQYEVRVGRTGFHTLEGIMTDAGGNVSLIGTFYNIAIPEGVTNVRISNATWVDTTVWQSQWCTEGQGPHRDVITLLRNNTQAWLTFDYGGRTFSRIPFMLDGTNPFGNMTIVIFPGMTGVTLQTNVGPHNAWDDVPDTHDNYAILFDLAPNTRIRGFITAPARIVSLEVHSIDTFGVLELPVSEVAVYGLAIPGLNVDVRRSNDANITNGSLLHRGPHAGGDIRFNTFTTDLGDKQLFMVQFGGNLGFSALQRFFDDYSIDLSEYLYEIVVPTGFSNVAIRNVANAALHTRADFAAGETILLLRTEQPVDLIFTFCCLTNERISELYLDGSDLFDGIECDCCDVNPGFPCDLCPGCDECTECSDCLPFRWQKYNESGPFNQSLYNAGTIRVWTYRFQWLANHPSPHYGYGPTPIFVTVHEARLESQDGRCAFDLGLMRPNPDGSWPASNFTVAFGARVVDGRTPEHNGFSWTYMHVYVETICGGTEWLIIRNNFDPCDCDFACSCPDCLWPPCLECGCPICEFICNPCLDCGNCLDCDECLNFRWNMFNNGEAPGAYPSRPNAGLAASGTIRMWSGFGPLDGGNQSLSRRTFTAVDQDGNDVSALVRMPNVWVPAQPDAAGHFIYYFNLLDVNKNAPWQTITLTITVCGEEYTALLVNSRFFDVNIFNNGPDGCPSTPNESLANAGLIRIWTRLNGVTADVPITEVTAVFRGTDVCAMEFIRLNNVEGGLTRSIDGIRDASWEFIYLYITVHGQIVRVVLHNDDFCACDFCPDCGECPECSECLVFRWDMFNNGEGPDAYPSRANHNLAASGTIRMWTGFGPVAPGPNRPTPIHVAGTISAYDQDGNCAMHLVSINEQWANPGYFNFIDVCKNAPWQYIILTIYICGEPYEAKLFNANFVEATFYLTPNEVTVCNTNRHARVYIHGTATGDITFNPLNNDPEFGITVRDDLWTPDGPVPGLVVGIHGGVTVTVARTIVVEVTRQGVTVELTIHLYPCQYVPVHNDYIVGWNAGSGAIWPLGQETSRRATWDAANLLPEQNPTRSGYALTGWRLVSNGSPGLIAGPLVTNDCVFSDLAANQDIAGIMLVAQWAAICTDCEEYPCECDPAGAVTVIFDANGGTGTKTNLTVSVGETFPLPANTFGAPDGYMFYGWWVMGYADPLGAATPGDIITVTIWPATTVTVLAQWTPIPANTAVVTFEPNGGTGTMAPETVSLGQPFELPANAFTAPDGYEFYGWWITGYADPLGTAAPGDAITVGGSVTVVAQWVPITGCDTCECDNLCPECGTCQDCDECECELCDECGHILCYACGKCENPDCYDPCDFTGLLGDLNGDGYVDMDDLHLMYLYLTGQLGDDETIIRCNADIDRDGTITFLDWLLLLEILNIDGDLDFSSSFASQRN
ncbi:MAG: InlB B-repeat-containing protein [Oscillospiraceae bacterium]|nr:InlB B-repeat-containing protein [Oscillospiraceae bacterium]